MPDNLTGEVALEVNRLLGEQVRLAKMLHHAERLRDRALAKITTLERERDEARATIGRLRNWRRRLGTTEELDALLAGKEAE